MLNADKYSGSLNMQCPTCGCEQFDYDPNIAEEERTYVCGRCKAKSSHSELMDGNQNLIDERISEVGKEITKEIQKEIEKAFGGNRKITIKF